MVMRLLSYWKQAEQNPAYCLFCFLFFGWKMELKELHRKVVKRKVKIVKNLILAFLCAFALAAIIFFAQRFIDSKINNGNSIYGMKQKWKSYDYQSCYDVSAAYLYDKPYSGVALTYHGYSSFFLSMSQNDIEKSKNYLDESINSLRLALLDASKSTVPQIEYMLGKAYFYKDLQSSYNYYADLAVKYLNDARLLGYKADDIPELLGLSYASLGMTMESISSFTEALLIRESDILLLSIAEQYKNAGQNQAAEQYLFRISKNCKDEKIVLKSHLLLGEIYLENGDNEAAKKEFDFILEKNENSADAYYGLGVIYENQGDLVKARSEWRKAVQIQSNHASALKKLAEYK